MKKRQKTSMRAKRIPPLEHCHLWSQFLLKPASRNITIEHVQTEQIRPINIYLHDHNYVHLSSAHSKKSSSISVIFACTLDSSKVIFDWCLVGTFLSPKNWFITLTNWIVITPQNRIEFLLVSSSWLCTNKQKLSNHNPTESNNKEISTKGSM